MARTRRSNFSRFLTGSITNRLLDNLAAPLLLVPAESRAANQDVASPRELNRVLVHLDGTDASERALDHAINFAIEDTICHLRRVLPLASLYTPGRGQFSHGSDIRGEAWRELFQARDKLERHGIKCTTRLLFDSQNAASAIVAQAKAMQALVLVAAARQPRMPWWLRTNVAEYVVRHAEVPVLIVPRD
jgi:nucleotide-binding universal stress UspA family protein